MVPVLPHHLLSDCPQGRGTIQNNPFNHCLSPFFLTTFATDILVNVFYDYLSLSLLCSPQPSVKLRLPSNPSGFARAPAADWPSTGHRGLGLWPQSAPHPPVAGLRHPEACTRHPPLRAQRQRALCHLQRVLTGESGGRRLCDSSSQVIDGGAACQPHLSKTQRANVVQAGPPLHALLSWEFPPTCVVSCFLDCRAQPRTRPQQTTRGLLA